ncbi:MAG: GtrA family protein [Faecousia sp.]
MNTKNESLIQSVKYTLFSISAGIIQGVTFTLLTELFGEDLNYWVRYLPALLLSVIWNFTFNRKFTFKSANNVPIAMAKVLGYYAVFTPVSTWLGELATQYFHISKGSIGEYIVLLVTMLANLITEFLFYKYVVFTDAKPSNEDKEN